MRASIYHSEIGKVRAAKTVAGVAGLDQRVLMMMMTRTVAKVAPHTCTRARHYAFVTCIALQTRKGRYHVSCFS
jgi:hypothetical protein